MTARPSWPRPTSSASGPRPVSSTAGFERSPCRRSSYRSQRSRKPCGTSCGSPGAAHSCLSLFIRDAPLGLLLLSFDFRLRRELIDSLEALASQVSLAVEGASLAEDLHRRRSETRFRSLVAHSSDLITVLDAHGTVTYQSPSVTRVLGYRVDEVEGTEFAHLLAPSDQPRLKQILAGVGESYVGGGSETHVIECRLKNRDGTWLQFEVQYTDLLQDEHVRGIVLNGRDVSEQKRFEDQLAHQAFHDPVTGPREPRTVRRPRPAFDAQVPAGRPRDRRDVHRPRRLQDRQRQPRPRRRRHGPP